MLPACGEKGRCTSIGGYPPPSWPSPPPTKPLTTTLVHDTYCFGLKSSLYMWCLLSVIILCRQSSESYCKHIPGGAVPQGAQNSCGDDGSASDHCLLKIHHESINFFQIYQHGNKLLITPSRTPLPTLQRPDGLPACLSVSSASSIIQERTVQRGEKNL